VAILLPTAAVFSNRELTLLSILGCCYSRPSGCRSAFYDEKETYVITDVDPAADSCCFLESRTHAVINSGMLLFASERVPLSFL
jgi:hypothetical protein